jgi:hypothetical protein
MTERCADFVIDTEEEFRAMMKMNKKKKMMMMIMTMMVNFKTLCLQIACWIIHCVLKVKGKVTPKQAYVALTGPGG